MTITTTRAALAVLACAAATPALAAIPHVHGGADCFHFDIVSDASNTRSPSAGRGESITAGGVTFIIEDLGGVGLGTQARAGFEAAANLWSRAFTDDVTVRLALGFAPLAPNVLAQAGSFVANVPYDLTRLALELDRTSINDRRSVRGLPGAAPISFLSNEPGTCDAVNPAGCGPIDARSRTLDADNTFDNNFVRANTSVIKALGLAGDVYARDAQITFSSNFAFDFDVSDGVTEGAFDFVAIAVHEIGHALGFRSGVDLVDNNALPFGGATLPIPPSTDPRPRFGLDGIAYATVLDLFRYQDGILDWTVGGAPCISRDFGETCGPLFSTGAFNGDRRQASHWKDNLGIGIMDPTFARGEIGRITREDLLAFDSFGWDLAIATPAPGALALFGLGAIGLMARRRRG